jgi:hypothetical protein
MWVKLSNNMIILLWYQTCDYKTCFNTEACILTGTGSIEICYALSACSPPCKAKPKSVTFGGGRTKIWRYGLASIIQMLTTNESEIKLRVYDNDSLIAYDICQNFHQFIYVWLLLKDKKTKTMKIKI